MSSPRGRRLRTAGPTEQTPERELRMIAVVYLESHDLAHALDVAQLAWRAHPSQENLLFTANVLQLEGRSSEVVSLLEKYRDRYGDSPGFLITIGESESDQKLYPSAERDLKRAVALAPESYPAHYIARSSARREGRSRRRDPAISEGDLAEPATTSHVLSARASPGGGGRCGTGTAVFRAGHLGRSSI